ISLSSDTVTGIPSAQDDNISVNEDESVTYNILANDLGLEDGGLVLSISTQPTHGAVVVNGDNTITYTPAANYNGSDSFIYQVCDVDNECSMAMVDITNVSVNDVPSVADETLLGTISAPITLDVLSKATGLGDGGIVVSISTQPAHGTVVVNTDGTITYTPATGYKGVDSFSYSVCDDDDNCSVATVSLTIVVLDDDIITIPEGFSPNGDGINDFYVIPDLDKYTQVSIQVFNRWGSVVFEQSTYQNNWDGVCNTGFTIGDDLPTGTYFYVILVKDIDKAYSGYIYLNR
nr:tandem-95 repeat protein [Breznakibacter sp.]